MLHGILFDLDGTLVASRLDFKQMRAEMALPDGVPILETILELPPADAARCWEILGRHEAAGAEAATLIPGVEAFLAQISKLGLRQAIVTRNSRRYARHTLDRLGLRFEHVMTRDDAPIKPRPEAIWRICESWGLVPAECVMLGDYRFDLEAGRAAGTRTVLYTENGRLANRPWASLADFLLHSFEEPAELLAWLSNPPAV